MDSATRTVTIAEGSANSGDVASRSGSNARGGRGRGRGQQGGNPRGGEALNANSDRAYNGGSERSRGRGRGGRGRGRGGNRGAHANNRVQGPVTADEELPRAIQPPPQPGGPGVSGDRLTKDAADNAQGETTTGDDVEAEVCFICASPVSHNSVAPCNHRTCHICALRLRALYKSKACAHCRTESTNVIFTDDPEKRYEEFTSGNFFQTDENLGISYERPDIFEDTVLLLRYNCPDESCDVACLGWPDLHRHVKSQHQKVMCDLCTRNKKVFTHEHELFTREELRRHEKFGDDNPGAVDQSGFKGHPECGFCRKRFYGDDELYAHCRENHERCHLCDRRTGGNNPQYFMDYNALEQHFSKEHFPCYDKECQEKKFVVFDSQLDLKAHQLEAHPNGVSKDARRQDRLVDISAFDYRQQYQEPRRERRRGGMGRNPDAEPMPATSTHLSRAEIAHQREREIHGTQTQTSRSFGGRLTQPEPPSQTVPRPRESPPAANALPAHTAASMPTSPRPAQALTPQDQARQLRHAAVSERAASLLRNDQVKLTEFRERVSAYRQDQISAGDLIDAFFTLFEAASDELGKLVKELADIFENASKRNNLLSAWSNWKAINEDYPSLPGPVNANTTVAGVLSQSVGASRVLKLKSSTAQSSRSAVSRQAKWGGSTSTPTNVSAAHSASSSAFPSLPTRGKASAPAPTPHWLASRPAGAATSNLSSARASPALGGSSSSSSSSSARPRTNPTALHSNREDLFPALPAAAKPTSTLFAPGGRGHGVIRNHSNVTLTNAWGGSNSTGAGVPDDESTAGEGAAAGKRKGNKGKKQVLIW